VLQRRPKVLPEHGIRAGIIGWEQQREHVDDSKGAREAHGDAQDQRDADGELAVGYEQGNRMRVREHELLQNRHHEGIRGALRQKPLNPALESAAEHELPPEDLVPREDQEERTNRNAKPRQGSVVAMRRPAQSGREFGVLSYDFISWKNAKPPA